MERIKVGLMEKTANQERDFMNLIKRFCLHLCLLLGAMSLVIDQLPDLFSDGSTEITQAKKSFDPKDNPDKMLAEAISATQKKPSIIDPKIDPKIKKEEGLKPSFHAVETFAELLQQKTSSPVKRQLLDSFASDKLALWSVFSNLSTFSGLVQILNQPIQAFERETLRSETFSIASGFDQIVYHIHLKNGGTSLVVAKVKDDSVYVSLFQAPTTSSGTYNVQRFKEGLWTDSSEVLVSQVQNEILKTKSGSSVVLSASVGL